MSLNKINEAINIFKNALKKTKMDTAEMLGKKASQDIKSDYRNKKGIVGADGYKVKVGDEEVVLDRSTEEMAQSVMRQLNDEGVKVFFDNKDDELLFEARVHELFGEIRPWKDFRQETGRFNDKKKWLQDIFSDIGADVEIKKR